MVLVPLNLENLHFSFNIPPERRKKRIALSITTKTATHGEWIERLLDCLTERKCSGNQSVTPNV